MTGHRVPGSCKGLILSPGFLGHSPQSWLSQHLAVPYTVYGDTRGQLPGRGPLPRPSVTWGPAEGQTQPGRQAASALEQHCPPGPGPAMPWRESQPRAEGQGSRGWSDLASLQGLRSGAPCLCFSTSPPQAAFTPAANNMDIHCPEPGIHPCPQHKLRDLLCCAGSNHGVEPTPAPKQGDVWGWGPRTESAGLPLHPSQVAAPPLAPRVSSTSKCQEITPLQHGGPRALTRVGGGQPAGLGRGQGST